MRARAACSIASSNPSIAHVVMISPWRRIHSSCASSSGAVTFVDEPAYVPSGLEARRRDRAGELPERGQTESVRIRLADAPTASSVAAAQGTDRRVIVRREKFALCDLRPAGVASPWKRCSILSTGVGDCRQPGLVFSEVRSLRTARQRSVRAWRSSSWDNFTNKLIGSQVDRLVVERIRRNEAVGLLVTILPR